MEHYQVHRALLLGYLRVVTRMLDRKEVFIERNIEFRGENFVRISTVYFSLCRRLLCKSCCRVP
jgi:hypothetical protein